MNCYLWRWTALTVVSILLIACAAVAPPAETGDAAPTAAAGEAADLLAEITSRGVLRISTDPAYPPQSELVEGVDPPADTRCTGDERPANQFTGFDIDVAVELANRLGVEPCFITPDWTLIVGGNWAGRWDIASAR
jgi:polar amino acid transport system substrate-binding protein